MLQLAYVSLRGYCIELIFTVNAGNFVAFPPPPATEPHYFRRTSILLGVPDMSGEKKGQI
jgi:hypothetical protein